MTVFCDWNEAMVRLRGFRKYKDIPGEQIWRHPGGMLWLRVKPVAQGFQLTYVQGKDCGC